MADRRAVPGREPLERRQRRLRIELAAVRHVQNLLVEADAAPALAGFRDRQKVSPEAGAVQRGMDVADAGVGAVVYDAGARQQPLAALVLELAPEPQRLRQHGDVFGLGVGEAQVSGGAVRGTLLVAGRELFEQGHVAAPGGQRPGGSRTHGPASDDHGVQDCVQGFLQIGRQRRNVQVEAAVMPAAGPHRSSPAPRPPW